MKRVRVSSGMQVSAAALAVLAVAGAGFGAAQLAIGSATMGKAVSQFASRQGEVDRMEAELAALQTEVTSIRTTTKTYIAKLEARHALLAAAIGGAQPDRNLAAAVLSSSNPDSKAAAEFAAMFNGVEQGQAKLVGEARAKLDNRYAESVRAVARLGVSPAIVSGRVPAMGGPYEPVAAGAVAAGAPAVPASGIAATPGKADPQFRALFNSWQRNVQFQQGMASIPSSRPVKDVTLTSGYGVRSDPFRGGAAMHAGVDIPGPIGTPIYATADGVVARSGWVGGYGNMVELGHGRGIQTRYGHLSSISVTAGTKVKRGQIIGLMGSTGRSTGSHLHYEVRVEGSAINPMPFLRSSDYLVALQKSGVAAMGGPAASK